MHAGHPLLELQKKYQPSSQSETEVAERIDQALYIQIVLVYVTAQIASAITHQPLSSQAIADFPSENAL